METNADKMTAGQEQEFEARGYKTTNRCTDGSPVMQKKYESGVTHVVWGHPDNDYWAAEFGEKIAQCSSQQEANDQIEQWRKRKN